MARQTPASMFAIASMLLVNAGFQDARTWQVGSESAYIIFKDKQGETYSLEFGGEDGTYLESICVLKGDVEQAYESDAPVEINPTLWTMDVGTAPFTSILGEGETTIMDYDLRVSVADWVLVLGALSCFLYDFREGKLDG